MHEALVAGSDVRGQQRLKRSAQPHSCGFITAVPSDEDGKDCDEAQKLSNCCCLSVGNECVG